jgi:hypothetical protein
VREAQQALAQALENFGDSYAARRCQEAHLLRTMLAEGDADKSAEAESTQS